MKIEMGKQYKSSAPDGLFDGRKFRRVLAVDRATEAPVIIELENGEILSYTVDGKYYHIHKSYYDLIEVTPYSDFKRGEPVMVSYDGDRWEPRHFSHESEGKFFCFADKKSNWTADIDDAISWKQCRRPTPEELKERGM